MRFKDSLYHSLLKYCLSTNSYDKFINKSNYLLSLHCSWRFDSLSLVGCDFSVILFHLIYSVNNITLSAVGYYMSHLPINERNKIILQLPSIEYSLLIYFQISSYPVLSSIRILCLLLKGIYFFV